MTFEEWVTNVDEGDDSSVQDCLLDGDYSKSRDVLSLLEQAYEAGWDACRDKWGGMTYEETVEDERSSI